MVIVRGNLESTLRFSITPQETWGMFVWCFQRGLREERRAILNVGGPIPKARVLDCVKDQNASGHQAHLLLHVSGVSVTGCLILLPPCPPYHDGLSSLVMGLDKHFLLLKLLVRCFPQSKRVRRINNQPTECERKISANYTSDRTLV